MFSTDDVLAYYVKESAIENFLVQNEPQASPFFHGVRLKMNENAGQGWSEMLRIDNGLYVSLADYRLSHGTETCHRNMEFPCLLSILLSGHFHFQIPGEKKQTVTAGDLWFFHGQFEQVSYSLPNENFCGLSILLPRDMIESWLGTACHGGSRGLERLFFGKPVSKISESQQAVPMAREMRQTSECIRIARELVYTDRQTLPDKLHFESLALSLLSRILTMGSPTVSCCGKRMRRVNAAVDEAVDILREEWDNPPTISSLARRISLNECYLKKWFRERMGMTVGAYIRQQRMAKALELIETGHYSILETAVHVGYSNPGHFSAAFKKYYGRLPSYYLSQSDEIMEKKACHSMESQ